MAYYVGHHPVKGRCAFASRGLVKGEIVLRNATPATAILEEKLHEYCNACLQPLSHCGGKPVVCDVCESVYYCDTCFKNESLYALHKVLHDECGECAFMKDTIEEEFNDEEEKRISAFVRIVMRLIYWKEHFSMFTSEIDSTWEDIEFLSPTEYQVSEEEDKYKVFVELVVQYLGKLVHEKLPDEKDSQCDVSELDSDAKGKGKAKEEPSNTRILIENLLGKVCVNSHGIVSFADGYMTSCALYPKASMFNHSCRPNCVWFIDETGRMCYRAVMDIPKDEELCIVYTNILDTKAERHRVLESDYGFECICDRCMNEPDGILGAAVDGIDEVAEKKKVMDKVTEAERHMKGMVRNVERGMECLRQAKAMSENVFHPCNAVVIDVISQISSYAFVLKKYDVCALSLFELCERYEQVEESENVADVGVSAHTEYRGIVSCIKHIKTQKMEEKELVQWLLTGRRHAQRCRKGLEEMLGTDHWVYSRCNDFLRWFEMFAKSLKERRENLG